ncbi:RPS8A [Sanghuangporus vaninii]
MSSGNPSSSMDGKPSTSYAQHGQKSGNLYSFSVHQPYTNWPLHTSHTTPYASTWYSHPTHHYSPQKLYREQATQTDESLTSHDNSEDSGEAEQKFVKEWDSVLVTFFRRLGLQQTLAGFHEDMLLLNEDWERKKVPSAINTLVQDLSELVEGDHSKLQKKGLEERKLEHVQFQKGMEEQSPSSAVKSVSQFLRQSRKRNNASNRVEFLLSVAEKRRRLNGLDESSNEVNTEELVEKRDKPGGMDVDEAIASCARADAKYQDRDTQIKYDIAKNEDGPLRRTMKRSQGNGESNETHPQHSLTMPRDGSLEPDAKNHPGTAARLETIEEHLAVRYVPSRPRSLFDRLKFLEDYIIRLERDHPPWAALHFNQPNRGWPPPPRSTPIIVPPHLASTESSTTPSEAGAVAQGRGTGLAGAVPSGQTTASKLAGGTKGKSSLHRAVMERLEIQRAIGDLTGSSATYSGTGISRSSRHKRSATGAQRAYYRKKRKFELGRQPANTRLGAKRIHTVRTRGGNHKFRALRLDSGNFAWGSEHVTKKTRIIGVVYNASNNELVRTNTLVKGAIIQIDATPFRQWYESHYALPVTSKLAKSTQGAEGEEEKKKSNHVKRILEERKKESKIEPALAAQFGAGRLYAAISSRPGQSGRADGYILEGKELEFYIRKLRTGKQRHAHAA